MIYYNTLKKNEILIKYLINKSFFYFYFENNTFTFYMFIFLIFKGHIGTPVCKILLFTNSRKCNNHYPMY